MNNLMYTCKYLANSVLRSQMEAEGLEAQEFTNGKTEDEYNQMMLNEGFAVIDSNNKSLEIYTL